MTAKALLIAAGAVVAFAATPAMAGENCGSYGNAGLPDYIAEIEQSTPGDAKSYTSIPYPLPTLTEDTQTAAVDGEAVSTTE